MYNSNSVPSLIFLADYNVSVKIDILKTKRVSFIQGLSPYCAVNTLHLGYIKPIY
jgi:hypothetical protein